MEYAFAAVRSRGPAWEDDKPLERQKHWTAHAAFMDNLYEQGFAALVGPLEGTKDALIILRASSEAEVAERFASDPWTVTGHLVTTWITRWQIRLGSLGK
jgi:uncharacterized protein YciI